MSLEGYCCGSLGTKNTICGSAKRKGGIRHLFLIKLNQTTITDWTNAAQWATALANGDVKLIQDIRGEYPEVSEVMSESEIGCQPEELDGFDHVLNWRDRAVNQANNEFYRALNDCSYHFGWYDCQPNGTAFIHVVEDTDVRFVCKPPQIEADNKTTQVYINKAMWSSPEFPDIYTAPAGVFY